MLTDAALSHLADQLTVWPGATPRRQRRDVVEHLPCWFLTDLSPLTQQQRLESRAHASAWIHHQIHVAGRAQQFALSLPSPARRDFRAVHAVFSSPLAERIDAALQQLAQRHDLDVLWVRMLVVPAVQVHALWLSVENDDMVMVASKPFFGSLLPYGRLLTVHQFLSVLERRRSHAAARRRRRRPASAAYT